MSKLKIGVFYQSAVNFRSVFLKYLHSFTLCFIDFSREFQYRNNRRLNIPVDRTDETWGAENNNHFSAGKFRYNQEDRPFLYQLPLSEIENNSQLSPSDQN